MMLCGIGKVPSGSMLTLISMRKVRNICFWLEGAVELVSTLWGNCTVLAIKDSMDFSSIETEAFNCNVLSSGSISFVLAYFENNWNGFCLVTIGIVEIAILRFNLLNCSITGLPHHGNVLVVRNSSLTNLTSGGTKIPIWEMGLRINSILKIDKISTNSGIDER